MSECSFSISKPILFSEFSEMPLTVMLLGKIGLYFNLNHLKYLLLCILHFVDYLGKYMFSVAPLSLWLKVSQLSVWQQNSTNMAWRQKQDIRCAVFKWVVRSISSFHIALSLPLSSTIVKRLLKEKPNSVKWFKCEMQQFPYTTRIGATRKLR